MPSCRPVFYPSPGHDNICVHDHTKNARYFVVAVGRCGSGVFTEALRANEQTDGFSGYVQRSCKRWEGADGVEEIWDLLCRQHHAYGCPPQILPVGFAAPTIVVRPSAAAEASASLLPPVVIAASPFAANPSTPRQGSGSGNGADTANPSTPCQGDSAASVSIVHSSVSPSPLGSPLASPLVHRRPLAPMGSVFASTTGFPLKRTPTFSSINAHSQSPSSATSTWTNVSDLFSDGTSPSIRTSSAAAASIPSIRAMQGSPSISVRASPSTSVHASPSVACAPFPSSPLSPKTTGLLGSTGPRTTMLTRTTSSASSGL
ncbi:hypothetical protein B0H12DRAFT_1239120 [Mycena haematopus]|nr:hypothetical protein B0H12DRAFT_1239120 [Mycena haematopus]